MDLNTVSRREKTAVVSLKITPSEYILWKSYCEVQNITISQLILQTITYFIQPEGITNILSDETIRLAQKNQHEGIHHEQITKIPSTLSIRIPQSLLREIDKFAKEKFLSRTALLKQAADYFFHFSEEIANFKINALEFQIFTILLRNLIVRMGMIDFSQIAAIFEPLDQSHLSKMLLYLEQKGVIGQKGREIYVSNTDAEGMTGILFIAEKLLHVIEQIKQNPEFLDQTGHISLFKTIFEYFEACFTAPRKTTEAEKVKGIQQQIAKLRTDIGELMGASITEEGN